MTDGDLQSPREQRAREDSVVPAQTYNANRHTVLKDA